MKKIKKLKELEFFSELTKEESLRLKGGCEYDNCGSSFYLDRDDTGGGSGGGKPENPTSCKCGCSGCIVEDGGAGFSLGMMYGKQDGHNCTWFNIW